MNLELLFKQLLERFKTQSPKLWVLGVFILSVSAYTAQQGELLGIIPIAGIWQKITVGISWLLAIVTGVKGNAITVEEYQSLETQLALLTDRYQKLTEEYEVIDANNEKLIEGISDRDIVIAALREEKRELEDRLNFLDEKYYKVVADLEKASEEINTLYALRDSLEGQLKACKESTASNVNTTAKAMTADYKIPKRKK
jgi:hypothetical protein